MNALNWCKYVLKEVRPDLFYTIIATTIAGKRKRTKVDGLLETLINKRFYSILVYPGLKVFSYFCKVKQWIGDK